MRQKTETEDRWRRGDEERKTNLQVWGSTEKRHSRTQEPEKKTKKKKKKGKEGKELDDEDLGFCRQMVGFTLERSYVRAMELSLVFSFFPRCP